eukprot:gene5907-9737_t
MRKSEDSQFQRKFFKTFIFRRSIFVVGIGVYTNLSSSCFSPDLGVLKKENSVKNDQIWIKISPEPTKTINGLKKSYMIDKSTLLKHGVYPKAMAASLLDLSLEELSQACKMHGIKRWPYHSTKGGHAKFSSTPFSELVIEKDVKDSVSYSCFTDQFIIESPVKKQKTTHTVVQQERKGSLSFILDHKP